MNNRTQKSEKKEESDESRYEDLIHICKFFDTSCPQKLGFPMFSPLNLS